MSTDKKVKELPAPIAKEIVLQLYGGFGSTVIDAINADEQVMAYLRHFPTLEVYPSMVDGVIDATTMVVYARPSTVADWAGVNARSLTQKCKQADEMVEYPYAQNTSYPLVDLIHASQHMGKVSKGRTSFINKALDVWFTAMAERVEAIEAMYADYDEEFAPLDVKEEYTTAVAAGVAEYDAYRAELQAKKEAQEALEALEAAQDNA